MYFLPVNKIKQLNEADYSKNIYMIISLLVKLKRCENVSEVSKYMYIMLKVESDADEH